MLGAGTRALVAAAMILLALTGSAEAHPVVSPDQSPAGATVHYVLSIPSEKPQATVRLEVQFPRQLRVNQVAAIPGWTLSLEQDGSGRLLGAIWDGGRSEAGAFLDISVLADNPASPTELGWSTIQTYADGSEVQWIGSPQSQFPAAISHVVNAGAGLDTSIITSFAGLAVSVGALIVATLALRAARSVPRDS